MAEVAVGEDDDMHEVILKADKELEVDGKVQAFAGVVEDVQ